MQKDNASGKYADLVYYNLGQASNYTESMLNNGNVLDISDVMEEVADEIDTSITEPTSDYFSDGKAYLAPIMYTPAGLYYNKAELSEDQLPKTWDEMWALGDQVHSENPDKYLFTYPIKGYFDNTVLGMLYQAGGEEYFQNALKYGEGTWDSDEGKKVLETIATLVGPNYLEKDTVANANVDGGFTKNQQAMIDGKAVFMPNGSWIIGEMAETTPEGFSWGVMPLPAFEEGGERVVTTMTEQVWIPAEAANVDDAKDKYINCDVLQMNRQKGVLKIEQNLGNYKTRALSLQTYILSKELFIQLVKEARKVSSMYWFKDIVNDHCVDMDIRAINYRGNVYCINDLRSYFESNLALLEESQMKQFSKDSWPIYTRTSDTAPAIYLKGGSASGSFIANGCQISGSVKNSIIGRGSVIGKGAKIENCVIMSDVVIGEDAVLKNVIIDKHSKVLKKKELIGNAEDPLYIGRRENV